MNKQQYANYEAAVAYNLKGLSFVSTGACVGCEDCGLTDQECRKCDGDGKDWQHGHEDQRCPNCHGNGFVEPTEHDRDLAEEPSFSWSECDACGSTLGGNRHPAHGRDSNGDILHLSICEDCLYYLNYGQLDDMTMMEMEESK